MPQLPLPISGTGVLYAAGTRVGEAIYRIRRAPGARAAAIVGVVRPVEDTAWKEVPKDVTLDLCRDNWWWDCDIAADEGAAKSRGRGLYRRAG